MLVNDVVIRLEKNERIAIHIFSILVDVILIRETWSLELSVSASLALSYLSDGSLIDSQLLSYLVELFLRQVELVVEALWSIVLNSLYECLSVS